jgi:Arc/MetJ family transcription regulator
MWCIVVHMGRTNIDIDDALVEVVMMRYQLSSKREAVDYALRQAAGQPMTRAQMAAMFGSIPDFSAPEDVVPDSVR